MTNELTETWPQGGEVMAVCFGIGNTDYEVGRYGVTRIEKTQKCGEYAYIPYLRIWSGDAVVAEIPQHKVSLVLFRQDKPHA